MRKLQLDKSRETQHKNTKNERGKITRPNSESLRRNITNSSKTLISKFQFTWTSPLKDLNDINQQEKKHKIEVSICLSHK